MGRAPVRRHNVLESMTLVLGFAPIFDWSTLCEFQTARKECVWQAIRIHTPRKLESIKKTTYHSANWGLTHSGVYGRNRNRIQGRG